jgi:hypothetical protein
MPKLAVLTSYSPNFTDNFIVQNISDSVKEREGGEGTSSLKMEVKSTILPLIHLEKHPRIAKQTSSKLELEVKKQKRSWNTITNLWFKVTNCEGIWHHS